MAQNLLEPGGSALWVDDQQADTPEMNAGGTMAEQTLWDGFVARLTQGESGFFADDCTPAKGAGDLDYTVLAGMGIVDVVALGGTADAREPTYTPIYVPTLQSASVAAHDPADPRKDILTLKPSNVDDESSTLQIFDGVGGFTPTSLPTRRRRFFTLNAITGTPAPGPVAPATPAGELRIALIDVPATSGPITVTDERAIIGIRGDTTKPRRVRAVVTAISVEASDIITASIQLQDTEGNIILENRRFIATVFGDTGIVDSAVLRINGVGAGLAQSSTSAARVVFDTSTGGLAALAVEDVTAALAGNAWLRFEMVEGYSSAGTPVIEPANSTIGYTTLVRLVFA